MPDASDNAPSEPEALPALDDLRAAVHLATDQLERLRERCERLENENEHLRKRVSELEADPAAGRDDTALLVGDDPDALRERLDQFIDALDDHLE